MKTRVSVNFTKFNTNKKNETVMEFQVRGELSDEQIVLLHKLKALGSGLVEIASGQMDFDDVKPEPREGVRGTINNDGTVNVEGDQASLDDYEGEEDAEGDGPDDTSEEVDGDDGSDADNNPMHDQEDDDLPFSDPEGDDLE